MQIKTEMKLMNRKDDNKVGLLTKTEKRTEFHWFWRWKGTGSHHGPEKIPLKLHIPDRHCI